MIYFVRNQAGAAFATAIFVFFAGCMSESPPPLKITPDSTAGPANDTARGSSSSRTETVVADLDQWDAYYLQGTKIGYGHLRIRLEGDRRVLSSVNIIKVQRFGEQTEQEIRLEATETTRGRLLDYRLTTVLGTEKATTEGRVEGNELLLTTRTRGKATEGRLPWVPENGGFYAVEDSLRAAPMQPGETRRIRSLILGFDAVADVELEAVGPEEVDVLSSTQELLRIEKTISLAGNPPLQETIWTDSRGGILKSRIAILNMESYVVPKEEALRDPETADFDMGMDVSVALETPIPNAPDAEKLVYRVTLEDRNPGEAFAGGPFQRVSEIDARTALVEIHSARKAQIETGPAESPANSKYLEPSAYIQSDDPAIKKLASDAVAGAADTLKKARTLERFAHGYITETNFSQAFSSAAEVCETKQGDCTEHAVFLAALARAVGIPSRLAVGLVYMEGASAFGYHMWTELRVGDVWVPFDATLGLGGAGATHLKLGDTALEGGAPFGHFLPLLETAGKLRIELAE